MKNTGLKSYTKQLATQVGNANISVNLNKEQANLHIALPLVSTVGLSPFSASLIYNYQNKSADGIFGNGFKPDCYAKIERSGDKYTVTNADGSVDVYEKGVANPETQMTVTNIDGSEYVTKGCWHVDDKFGNKKIYGALTEYPQQIESKSGDVINFDFVASDKKISNAHGDAIIFARGSNGKVTNVKYSHNDATNATVQLGYSDDNNLQTLQYYNDRNALVASTRITYAEDSVTVTDEISGAYSKYTFADSRVTTVESGIINQADSVHTVAVVYGDNVTTVTDWRGKTAAYCFDGDGMPAYQMDSDGNVVGFVFDPVTKSLLSQSSPVSAKRAKDNLFPQSVADYTAQAVTVTKVQTDDAFFGDILNDSLCRVAGSGSRGVLSHKVPSNGISTDTVTAVIWCKQLTPATDDCYAQVALSTLKNGGTLVTDYRRLTSKTLNNAFQLITLGITAQSSFDSIELTVLLRGGASVEIGGVQVLRKDFGAFYSYDGKGNATQMSQGGATTNVGYNTANLPSTVSGADSTAYSCKYDDKGNLTQVDLAYDVTVTNEYDEHNRVTKSTTTSADGLCMETTKQYDQQNGRFISSQTDELGVTVAKYEYDEFGKIRKLTDALNATTEFSYHDSGLIKDILLKNAANTQLSKATYDYDGKHRLTKATLSNGSVYGFTYDNCGNIENISVNGVTAFKFCYDVANGNVVSQQYGESGDKFTFAYNADNQIQAVNYVSANGIVSKRFTYAYNDRKQLEVVCDQDGNEISSYVYDQDGRVTRVTSELAQIDYRYDNLSQVNNANYRVQDVALYNSFDRLSRSRKLPPRLCFGEYMKDSYIGLFDVDTRLIKGDKAIVGVDPLYNYKICREGALPYMTVGYNGKLGYQLTDDTDANNYENGCIQFWFRPQNLTTAMHLFGVKSSVGKSEIYAYTQNKKVQLDVKDTNGKNHHLITSDDEVLADRWNFFAVSFHFRDDGVDYGKQCELTLTLNSVTQVYRLTNGMLNVDVAPNPVYYIGRNGSGSALYYYAGDIACLNLSPRKCQTIGYIRQYYKDTKDFIESSQFVDKYCKTIDVSQTVTFVNDEREETIREKPYFQVFPLQNNVTSLMGMRPSKLGHREDNSKLNTEMFRYNELSHRYAYVADGSELVYNSSLYNSGTILMRAYSDTDGYMKYFIECKDSRGSTFGLYRQSQSGKLCLQFNGRIYQTKLSFSLNQWHTVGLSFNRVVESQSVQDMVGEFRIYLDGATEYVETPDFNFNQLLVSVGRKFDDEVTSYITGDIYKSYPLEGQIEMLRISDAYLTLNTLEQLISRTECVTYAKEFDKLGLLTKTCLYNGDSRVMARNLSYKTRQDTKYVSRRVASEKFTGISSGAITAQYSYDDAGNVTQISGNTHFKHKYTYDERGFLTKDNYTQISYDANGNITDIGDVHLEYDSVIKDRLVKVGGKPVTYDVTNPLNPVKYNFAQYKYEGRRLTQYVSAGTAYEYGYNHQGLRISKTCNNQTTHYIYDGAKLITELAPDYRLDFLYDEYDQLYGFVKDLNTKYFYIRDIINNILGIIDTSGNVVVKYDYTAYGKVTVVQDSENLSRINPILYKGYYYDKESGMYYCQSRYYVPEWGRWLNADNPSYMQTYNITSGLNLFQYCKNNPILFSDPEGTFVSAILGALSALVSGLVMGQSAGQILYNMGVAVVVGLIVDAVSVATCGAGTLLVAAIGIGVISAAADVGAQMLFEDRDFKDVDWGRAATIGTISSVTSAIGMGVGKFLPVDGGSMLGQMANMVKDIPTWSAGIVYSFGIGMSMNLLTGSEVFNFKQKQVNEIHQIGDYIPRHPIL